MNILKHAPLNTCSVLFLGAKSYARFKEFVIILPTGSPESLYQFPSVQAPKREDLFTNILDNTTNNLF